ncbi:MAG: 5'/3'-nucleotidase SurE [Polyangiaceae bacterium]
MDQALRERIEGTVNSKRVVLFMKGNKNFPQCGFSAQVVSILKKKGVDFLDVNILSDQDLRQGLKEFSNWPTFPQLYVGGKLVGGCDIVTGMAESGELESGARHQRRMTRPLVLLSNDDGYRAAGINALAAALRESCDVVVCAPEVEQSASSHALSLNRPLRLFPHGEGVFSVDGTPADCVYVALYAEARVLPRRPDVVVSGMNHGVNLGDDVFYSGTVAAAREGALKGIASIAFSAALDAEPRAACRLATEITLGLAKRADPRPILLNVNVPPGNAWPVRATRLGRRVYRDEVEFRRDPRGREYLWLGGPGAEHHPESGSDTEAFDAGEVSVTPLVLDLWGRSEEARVRELVERFTTA